MVSNIYPSGAERPVFQTQMPLNPGSSGGPILDRRGRVVGIVTAGITGSNSINFGIRMDVAIKNLEKLTSLGDYLIIKAPEGVPVFVDGKMLGTGPRIIITAVPKHYEVFAVIKGKMKKIKIKYPTTKVVELN